MGLRTPSASSGPNRSRHDAWPDSCTSRATQCGVTPSATSDATFFNATVDISRATSCGVTQVLVAPRGLARPKRATSWNFSLGGVSFNILD
jgi:invasion protein IalB